MGDNPTSFKRKRYSSQSVVEILEETIETLELKQTQNNVFVYGLQT